MKCELRVATTINYYGLCYYYLLTSEASKKAEAFGNFILMKIRNDSGQLLDDSCPYDSRTIDIAPRDQWKSWIK